MNNNLQDNLDASKMGEIGNKAFSANRITEVIVGEKTEFWDNVFSGNKTWVKITGIEKSDISRGLETKKYDSGYGQVVNPVTVIVNYVDKDGNSIAPEQSFGDDLTQDKPSFEKNKQSDITPRNISGYKVSEDTEGWV